MYGKYYVEDEIQECLRINLDCSEHLNTCERNPCKVAGIGQKDEHWNRRRPLSWSPSLLSGPSLEIRICHKGSLHTCLRMPCASLHRN